MLSGNVDENHMDKLYEKINNDYLSLTREMTDSIVRKFDEIQDMWFDRFDMNDKEKRKNDNNLLTKRILKSKIGEASTFNTVHNFYTAVYIFNNLFNDERERKSMFNGRNEYDFILCAVRDVDMKLKKIFLLQDDTVEDEVNEFLNRDLNEIDEVMTECYKKFKR